jgi:hypothetical protein
MRLIRGIQKSHRLHRALDRCAAENSLQHWRRKSSLRCRRCGPWPPACADAGCARRVLPAAHGSRDLYELTTLATAAQPYQYL